jgi:putative membrane-bound dehydrogenase-like protein
MRWLAFLALAAPCAAQDPPPLPPVPPREPAEALRAFQLRPGFGIELVAAEPTVVDPVDLAFDEEGRLFVAEMVDYPYGDAERNPPQGRVRLLTDGDGDGRFERSTVYAERLRWPTGLALWDGGVFVASVPDLLYFKDTDGDGRADRREVVLTGFGSENVQGLVNNVKWGLDNWFHGATSSSRSRVRSVKRAEAGLVDLGGRDFRFRPSGEFETLSGGGLFGNTFDDFGRRFVCRNWYPVYHVVLEDRYLRRNPELAVASGIHYIAPNPDPVYRTSPPEAWRTLITRMFLSGQLPGAVSEPTGRNTAYFTSASGATLYRGTALGEECYGNLFVGEAATNLVHRKILAPDGATFRAERADRGVEFLASTDNWFRPVNLAHGPDGALYVCDMYREVIEHPMAIPEAVKRRLDLTSGKDRGRIWRVTREGAPPYRRPALGGASTAELVEALRRPDAWWRETAGRLLFQRQDRSAVPALGVLAAKGERAATRGAALWALEGLGSLAVEAVEEALGDRAPEIREQAVRLAEGRPKTLPALLRLVEDPHPRVRFQLAMTLGEFDGPGVEEALVRLAARDGGDAWARPAILTSTASPAGRALGVLRKGLEARVPFDFVHALAGTIGARNESGEVAAALSLARESTAVLLGMGEGLRRRGGSLSGVPGGGALIEEAEKAACDEKREPGHRADAIRLLAHGTFDRAERTLLPFLDARQPPPLQAAAVQALATFRDPKVGERFLASWKALTPAARPEALSWFRRPERYPMLLGALEEGRLSLAEVSLEFRRTLIRDPRYGERARRLLGEGAPGDRRKVIAGYLPALDREGDAARGKEVFLKNCAACHRAGGEGREVGPDLSTVKERSPEELLVAILDPNREINPQFLHYKLLTKAGSVLEGVIAGESATSVTLKRAEGEGVTVLRSEIETLASTSLSLMPDGLEKGIDLGQMADLLEFVRRIGESR